MTLPYSEQAEAALIARLLVDPHPLAALQLEPEHFHVPMWRSAYRAMRHLVAQGKPIDVITLADEGVKLGDVLETLTPAHAAPVQTYAEIIRRDSFRRRFITNLTELAERAGVEDDPQALIAALQSETATLAENAAPSDTLGRIDLDVFRSEPPPPLAGVVAPQGTTIFYGDGGDGKGWVVASLIARLGIKVAILDFEMQPQEWGYRLSKFGMSLSDVLYFSPPTTLDKWATAETARLLRSEGVELLVIDSAMYAADVEDPYAPSGALAYGRARRRLNNLPAMLLAHITGNADKVFGSVFWKNECRISWRLIKDQETRQRRLICKKANGYSWLEGTRLDIVFDEPTGTLELVEGK